MTLIVKKFGGTSVATIERINLVADKIQTAYQAGERIVVVVSAMAKETDKLDTWAHQLSDTPDPREVDVLLATGEQVTIALLSIALIKRGCNARSYLAHQVKIRTNHVHNKARILHIDTDKIMADVNNGIIVVVAGFQGVDINSEVTTIGRGGSDTTAVALAAALKADECQIYTDVKGVYTADPNIVPDATIMPRITFEEMLELASLGAKVIQIRAVEFAGRYNVPVRILSTFEVGSGTLIAYSKEDTTMEEQVISGITFCRDEARIIIRGLPDNPGFAGKILTPISDANIEVDMIVQNVATDGTTDFTFTVHRRDLLLATKIVRNTVKKLDGLTVHTENNIAKLSMVGIGMRSYVGVASKMFRVLGEVGVNIQLIATSEIKVSVLIDENYLEVGVKALHDAFGLGYKLGVEDKSLCASL